jgi:hypothetical protein
VHLTGAAWQQWTAATSWQTAPATPQRVSVRKRNDCRCTRWQGAVAASYKLQVLRIRSKALACLSLCSSVRIYKKGSAAAAVSGCSLQATVLLAQLLAWLLEYVMWAYDSSNLAAVPVVNDTNNTANQPAAKGLTVALLFQNCTVQYGMCTLKARAVPAAHVWRTCRQRCSSGPGVAVC